MQTIWITGAVALVVLLAVVWWLRTRSPASAEHTRPSLDGLDTLSAWSPTPTRVLTSQERLAYAVLVKALPDHMILAQVPLSRFLKVPTRNSYTEWLSRIGQVCADLVVCDHSSQVVAVVDVRVPPHQASERNRKRHDRMKRVLKATGIPLHIWFENSLPTPDVARQAIVPDLPVASGATMARAPVAPNHTVKGTATPAGRPMPTLVDETAVVEADEVIEMRDPPASTWFDDLDGSRASRR